MENAILKEFLDGLLNGFKWFFDSFKWLYTEFQMVFFAVLDGFRWLLFIASFLGSLQPKEIQI